ncbi:adhesion G-protein coupled receptor D1-like [Amphiura filiformis]|uniref:adhesion G-protein coupled receptor D1-like n=1 Tax=Amphiura filiformis TaxID=82378 RepID=UPI003B216A1C
MQVDPTSTQNVTVCTSTHLTNFAILMSVNEIPLTKVQETSLSVITYVGCTLSLICLLVTIILLFILRDLQRSTRISILKHLAIAMFIAQFLFLAGVETAVGNPKLCTAVAVCLHYFFLTVMCWMLSQGLYLYIKLRRSAKGVWDFVYFCVLGWGFPVVLVAIVAGIKHEAYGTDSYCWLTTEGGAMWAFVGPALAIIAVNTVVIILAMKAFTSVKVYKDKSDKEKMRSSLRAVVIMLPILGLTWIFGVFSFNKETLLFQYLFAILNSLQGVFLFIFNILWNDEIKGSLRRKLGKKFASDESSMFFNRVLGTASIGPSKSTETSLSTTSTGTKM